MQESGGQFDLVYHGLLFWLVSIVAFLCTVHVTEPLGPWVATCSQTSELHRCSARVRYTVLQPRFFNLDDAWFRAIHQRTDLVVLSLYANYGTVMPDSWFL